MSGAEPRAATRRISVVSYVYLSRQASNKRLAPRPRRVFFIGSVCPCHVPTKPCLLGVPTRYVPRYSAGAGLPAVCGISVFHSHFRPMRFSPKKNESQSLCLLACRPQGGHSVRCLLPWRHVVGAGVFHSWQLEIPAPRTGPRECFDRRRRGERENEGSRPCWGRSRKRFHPLSSCRSTYWRIPPCR